MAVPGRSIINDDKDISYRPRNDNDWIRRWKRGMAKCCFASHMQLEG